MVQTTPFPDRRRIGGNPSRFLTVADPDTFFARAIAAGATEVVPVGEEHGWLGRVGDPYGHDWEIGRELH